MYFAIKVLILILPFLFVLSIFFLELSLIIISSLAIYLIIKEKKFKYFKNLFFIIILLFSIYLITMLVFFHEIKIGYKYSIFYLRYALYIISVGFILDYLKFKEKLLYSFLIINLILVIDSIFQYIFGYNIFGYNILENSRISSLFGDELILGSYILRISPLVFSLFFFISKEKSSNLLRFLPLVIILNLTVILLSGERTAFFLYLFYCFYLLIFLKIKLKFRLTYFISTILFSIIILTFNSIVYERIINKTLFEMINNYSQGNYYNKNELMVKNYYKNECHNKKDDLLIECEVQSKLFIFSPTHNNYYLTAINIFKEHKFFGSGPKSYRILCNNDNFKINKYSCATHPHNFYIQLLTETGISGVLFIIILYFYFLYFLIKTVFSKSSHPYLQNASIVLIGGLLINLFPFAPSANFFNNWISIINYFPVIYLMYDRNFK